MLGRHLPLGQCLLLGRLQELREGEVDVSCLVHRAGGAVEDPSAGDDVGPVEMLLELRGVDEACELFRPFIGVLGDMGVA